MTGFSAGRGVMASDARFIASVIVPRKVFRRASKVPRFQLWLGRGTAARWEKR